MKSVLTSSLIVFAVTTNCVAALISGVATNATSTTATGTVNGITWTAQTTSTSPFIGINLPTGTWDVSLDLPTNGLFIGAGSVNGGDVQRFNFDAPITNLCFFIENFDSNSAATITTDGAIELLGSSQSINFTKTTPGTATLTTSNLGFDGEGDAVIQLSENATFIEFDYTDGVEANGIFYGFAWDNQVTAVPEPSSFLFLLLCGSTAAYIRRNRVSVE